MLFFKKIRKEFLSPFMKEVGINRFPRPYPSKVGLIAAMAPYKNAVCKAAVIWLIGPWVLDLDPGIDNGDPFLSFLPQLSHELLHFFEWKIYGVKRKVHPLVHVVDVGPYCLERNACMRVIRHDRFHLPD
jgi:hypothetical protein